MTTWAVILAAGRGSRIADATGGERKQFIEFKGRPLFWNSALTCGRVEGLEGVVFVFPEDDLIPAQTRLIDLDNQDQPGLPWLAVAGGDRRQDSVANGLAALPDHCTRVLVHDAARPFATPDLFAAVMQALESGAVGAVPGLPVTDTVKRTAGDAVLETLNRAELTAVQTPQGFDLAVLKRAHERAGAEGWDVTDDASMVERLAAAEGFAPVRVVPGEETNVKITTPKDLTLLRGAPEAEVTAAEQPALPDWTPCTGWGYDVHRYGRGDEDNARPLKLGSVPIQGGPVVLAHSDGDVLLHALADALLGVMAEGDIGAKFPDTDPAFEGMESGVFISEIMLGFHHRGYRLTHVDLTVIAQTPKLAPHREHIRKTVSRLLALDPSRVNVKATTEEKLGFTGRKEGIKAVAAVTALRPGDLPS